MLHDAPNQPAATPCGAAIGAHEIEGRSDSEWTARQVAHLLGISIPAVQMLVHTGDLRPVRPGVFASEQVRAYMRTAVLPNALRSARMVRSA